MITIAQSGLPKYCYLDGKVDKGVLYHWTASSVLKPMPYLFTLYSTNGLQG